ncbi:MAG: Ig-like domain-containing protein [Paludibacteraceae bacterium]|nr:Ig-like domain-containing protein [Paludibacteraceae bacterium]
MKANKFFAVALAALTLVGFNACKGNNGGGGDDPDPEQEATLALDQTSIQLEVDGTATLNATVEATWSSSDAAVATVVGNGKEATVTAIKEGNAVISATTKGGQTKTCVVLVKAKAGPGPEGKVLKGSQVWPMILDGTTADANASKIVADFRPNDVDQFLYVWEETYAAGTASGLNFHGNGDGYTALAVTGKGWAGCGFNLNEGAAGVEPARALRDAIVADPDNYFLHMAIKSTDNANQCFYFMNTEGTKFVLGAASVYDGPVYANFDRDGAWHEFDIPMSKYAAVLASADLSKGNNIFVALTEGVSGYQLNLDAVYFYKK